MNQQDMKIDEFARKYDLIRKFHAELERLEQSDFSVFEGLQTRGKALIQITFNGDSVHLDGGQPKAQIITTDLCEAILTTGPEIPEGLPPVPETIPAESPTEATPKKKGKK
jgi:hypothetical protein